MARPWEIRRKRSFLAELKAMQTHFRGLGGYEKLMATVEAEIALLEKDLANVDA